MDRTRVASGLHSHDIVHIRGILSTHRELPAGDPHHAVGRCTSRCGPVRNRPSKSRRRRRRTRPSWRRSGRVRAADSKCGADHQRRDRPPHSSARTRCGSELGPLTPPLAHLPPVSCGFRSTSSRLKVPAVLPLRVLCERHQELRHHVLRGHEQEWVIYPPSHSSCSI
jgi:hypothetical protein